MGSNVMDVISYLNLAAAAAYQRDGDESMYGWAYSTAATRVYAALTTGDLNND